MPITLYCLSGSPFSWKVWLALEHKALPYKLRVLSADAGDLKSPECLAVNPRGKVPIIVDDGFALAESTAIIEYIEDQYPQFGGRLWPSDVRERALARRHAIETDAYVYPHVRTLVRGLLMRGGPGGDSASIEAAKAELAAELAALEKSIEHDFLTGATPTAADFAMYPMTALLMRIQSLRPDADVSSIIPDALRNWMARIEALPYFAKTTPPHWRQS